VQLNGRAGISVPVCPDAVDIPAWMSNFEQAAAD
jgi:hypothetical protein